MEVNKRGAVSIKALQDAIPFSDDLLFLSIFGSQVKGNTRPDSDLDVLCVVRSSEVIRSKTIRDVIEIPGGVEKSTIIPHGIDTISRTANLYGSVEYHVLREEGARTLFRSPDFHVDITPYIDYEFSAKKWLQKAKENIFGDWASTRGEGHLRLYIGVGYALRSLLMRCRIDFSFTRDIRVLCDMLPSNMRPPLDVQLAGDILSAYDKDRTWEGWSDINICETRSMAERACGFADKILVV
ncbi:MAG: nucleotidyltransferase domain-containing protein [Cenarchaeum sp. SB0663_bin_5]|nr:nucleotidyltransferase domain-containing protein [Cenarchaeum sp. SB0663_bin_5]MYH04671.1 nucleotidyltransferase domain-containing protein [Cenarchaeum sp. SB0675_bin_21]